MDRKFPALPVLHQEKNLVALLMDAGNALFLSPTILHSPFGHRGAGLSAQTTNSLERDELPGIKSMVMEKRGACTSGCFGEDTG